VTRRHHREAQLRQHACGGRHGLEGHHRRGAAGAVHRAPRRAVIRRLYPCGAASSRLSSRSCLSHVPLQLLRAVVGGVRRKHPRAGG
jgi:hypothetical protein